MFGITIDAAKKQLMDAYPGLYADFITDMIGDEIRAFRHAGAVIILMRWCATDQLIWYICDTSGADMDAALDALNKSETTWGKIMIHAGEIPGVHCLVFSAVGKPYIDPTVRTLGAEDADLLAALTTVGDDEDIFTKSIANNLVDALTEAGTEVLGIFDQTTLAGVTSLKSKNHGEVVVISNVFVSRKHRGNGYASRLIRAALATYPGATYSYSCGSDNPASIAAARSAGFVFEGTYDFL